MMYNKPIWSPNVILMNVTDNIEEVTLETIALIKKLDPSILLIGLYINHKYKEIKESQIILSNPDYSIYKEVLKNEQTIPSRLLSAGARHVYYIVPKTANYRQAFVNLIDILGYNFPIICIAAGLANDIDSPAIVDFENSIKEKIVNRITISELKKKEITFEGRKFKIL
ncbi:MAG: hypothetical protein JEZ09_04910 [Salinivirgaceae bacterium]|nr:hypothetical protein [Salinivirgaceae bacterium]